MNARALLGTAVAVVLLVGCARTTNGSPAETFPTTVQALADRIESGAKSLKTAHLAFRVGLAGESITAHGDEELSDGKPTGLALVERIPAFGTLRLIQSDDKSYVRLPRSQRTSDKPWVLVRPGSSNPVVSQLAQTLQTSNQLTAVDSIGALVGAAKNLRFVGTETIGSARVGHYTLTIDVSRLPDDFPQKQTLQQVGLSSLPLEAWFDTSGHTRKVVERIAVVGQHVSVLVRLGNFDAPVHISAPPPGQVDTS